jgi:hypothetical protein
MARALIDPQLGAAKPIQRPTGDAVTGGERKSTTARTAAETELIPAINRSRRAAVSRRTGVRAAEELEGFEASLEPPSSPTPRNAESARAEAMAEF